MTLNDDYLRPLLQVISSTLLALLSIRMVSMVNIQNGWLKYVGINSLSLFLAHMVLLYTYGKINDVYLYVFVVISGAFTLTWIYKNTFERILN